MNQLCTVTSLLPAPGRLLSACPHAPLVVRGDLVRSTVPPYNHDTVTMMPWPGLPFADLHDRSVPVAVSDLERVSIPLCARHPRTETVHAEALLTGDKVRLQPTATFDGRAINHFFLAVKVYRRGETVFVKIPSGSRPRVDRHHLVHRLRRDCPAVPGACAAA